MRPHNLCIYQNRKLSELKSSPNHYYFATRLISIKHRHHIWVRKNSVSVPNDFFSYKVCAEDRLKPAVASWLINVSTLSQNKSQFVAQ